MAQCKTIRLIFTLTRNLDNLICDLVEFLQSEFVEKRFDFTLDNFGGKFVGFGAGRRSKIGIYPRWFPSVCAGSKWFTGSYVGGTEGWEVGEVVVVVVYFHDLVAALTNVVLGSTERLSVLGTDAEVPEGVYSQ